MNSTTSTTRTPESAQADKPKDGLNLNPTKITASALAAISAAGAASFLGTTGTWIGAGVGSVLATVGTDVYQHSLQRTGAKLKTVAPLSAVSLRRSAGEQAAGAQGAEKPAGRGLVDALRDVRWGREDTTGTSLTPERRSTAPATKPGPSPSAVPGAEQSVEPSQAPDPSAFAESSAPDPAASGGPAG